jgi:glyoxylase-like metal-dependent hydrolase (beta-lactamase superfamily II)
MGITSLDVSDDGKEVVVGTIAAFGDPNVIVLDSAGKIVRQYQVGQQWIDNVAFLPGSNEVVALCTMPAGKAGDRVESFRLKDDQVLPETIKQEGPWFFHYGDHSNHPTMKLARSRDTTALLVGNQVVIHRKNKEPSIVRLPINDPDATVSLAVDDSGWAVVGATTRASAAVANLYLIDPDQKKPVWSRAVNREVEKAPALEKGQYGTPTLPSGKREELPQRDEKVWAPLSVAIYSTGGKRLIAAADYQGWQRWVYSSATRKEDNQGLRFMPTRPTITVYDDTHQVVQRFAADEFQAAFWCDMQFAEDGKRLVVWPHSWKCRGLAGQSILPTDDHADTLYSLDIASGKAVTRSFRPAVSDVAVSAQGALAVGSWGGLYRTQPEGSWKTSGPRLVRFSPDGARLFVADTGGIVGDGEGRWRTDLNTAVRKSPKAWVANARATPIVPGVWQIPGGRVESDLGGQRLMEAPDGYILIEGHSGLSFEREWAALEAVGLDPKKVKYVLATHEHGDHSPGAYLWRVVTGAKFVCSAEMAYTLQHHIPGNTGYGLHPPVPTDVRITEDTDLDLAGLKVRAIRIPGHTFGSMAWYFEKSGKTFVAFGDLIMPRGVLGYSGSVNFSATDVLASLRKLRDLKADLVLPGHGAVEGPENYFHSGIEVGQAVGWGFIKPERPDPRFRITQKNVLVVGWGQNATSAAFGDVNGDGRPDVVLVSPAGDGPAVPGSIVKFFLNQGGKFHDRPDYELNVPQVDQPHKIRVTMTKAGPFLLVAGKTAALLAPLPPPDGSREKGKLPTFSIVPFDLGDGNQLRFVDEGSPLVSRRFGGFYALDLPPAKANLRKFVPNIDGPYTDFRMLGNNLLTSYGQLYRRTDGAFPRSPALQLSLEKDWTFLAVGDFNGDGQPDAAFLSYGMDRLTAARVFYGRKNTELILGEKADAVLPLGALLNSTRKNQHYPLVRDAPVVADWNGDGMDDLVVAHGQSDEVLVFLGDRNGLSQDRLQRISLEYRVHYEHGVYVGDFNGDGKADLAVFGYTNTGVGAGGPPAVYVWLQ